MRWPFFLAIGTIVGCQDTDLIENPPDAVYCQVPVQAPEATRPVERLVTDDSCLPRALQIEASGALCGTLVFEVVPASRCACDQPGRAFANYEFVVPIRNEERVHGACDAEGTPRCDEVAICEILRVDDADLESCSNDLEPSGAGYCYIDALSDLDGDGSLDCAAGNADDCLGNPEILTHLGCDVDHQRTLRLLDVDPAATIYLAASHAFCTGSR